MREGEKSRRRGGKCAPPAAARTRCILGSLGSANYGEWNAGRCYQAARERTSWTLRVSRLYAQAAFRLRRRLCLLTSESRRCIRARDSLLSSAGRSRGIPIDRRSPNISARPWVTRGIVPSRERLELSLNRPRRVDQRANWEIRASKKKSDEPWNLEFRPWGCGIVSELCLELYLRRFSSYRTHRRVERENQSMKTLFQSARNTWIPVGISREERERPSCIFDVRIHLCVCVCLEIWGSRGSCWACALIEVSEIFKRKSRANDKSRQCWISIL